jgi:hypothetical protein
MGRHCGPRLSISSAIAFASACRSFVTLFYLNHLLLYAL